MPIRRKARPPIAIHHARGLTAEDRGFEEGIPVTALPRTLLDFAAGARGSQLDRAIERAEEQRLFDLREVEALLGRTTGHPGRGRLVRAIELYREPVFTRSGLERRFLALVERAGLPRPATGFNVAGHELDVYWVDEEGVATDRVTGKRLEREPDRVVKRIARLLEQRRGGR